MDLILETTMKVLSEQDEISNTALHLAAEAGHVEIVETLIHAGANKESRLVFFFKRSFHFRSQARMLA